MTNNKFFRFGEPEIGKEHCVFQDKESIMNFLRITGENNLVPIFEVKGKILRDERGPDGLVVTVENYRRIK